MPLNLSEFEIGITLESQSSHQNLKYISDDDLLFRTENLVKTERKIMHFVLSHILEIMDRKLYADLGFDSMFSMMIKNMVIQRLPPYGELMPLSSYDLCPKLHKDCNLDP